MRQYLIANWKMNPATLKKAVKLLSALKRSAARQKNVVAVFCPPSVYLAKLRGDKKSALGAQNVFFDDGEAHTGEISPAMLKDLGVRYCIIGHSERRALGEDNELVQKKVRAALSAGLSVVLCIGEKTRDHQGTSLPFLEEELRFALRAVEAQEIKRLLIAYEPIWAIGKEAHDAMPPEEVHETVIFVRKILSEMFTRPLAESTPVLYGGSVEPQNIAALISRGRVNGFLVGHASLNAEAFSEMLRIANRAR